PLVGRVLHPPAAWRDRVAFTSAAGGLSFADLAAGTRQVAGWLRDEAGVAPGDRVAICLPKSLEAVLAMYGILAAGAAYVPLQHQGPPARLGAILASVRPRLLLSSADVAAALAATGGPQPLPPLQEVPVREGGAGLGPLLQGRSDAALP